MNDQPEDVTPVAATPIESFPEPDPMVPSLDLSEVEIGWPPGCGTPPRRRWWGRRLLCGLFGHPDNQRRRLFRPVTGAASPISKFNASVDLRPVAAWCERCGTVLTDELSA